MASSPISFVLYVLLVICASSRQVFVLCRAEHDVPLVISTWPFLEAVRVAWKVIEAGESAVDAVVEGCSTCEDLQCDGSGAGPVSLSGSPDTDSHGGCINVSRFVGACAVGYGGSPDENGETTLDAMVFDGTTMDAGAVAALRYVKTAARAAKLVLEHTEHSLLVGDQASAFALSMGVPGPENLSTADSLLKWSAWTASSCQPNFWRNVYPDSHRFCGPYMLSFDVQTGMSTNCNVEVQRGIDRGNHDTISMAAIDAYGKIAVATSTNGATFKIPGRVGDGPIIGAGAYADSDVGACGATGDGDIMMRFLPCYQVVESMRQGMSPKAAAHDAIARIRIKYPAFTGAVFAVNRTGIHAGACNNWTFQYAVRSRNMDDVQLFTVTPEEPSFVL